jgi:hypothetical protein
VACWALPGRPLDDLCLSSREPAGAMKPGKGGRERTGTRRRGKLARASPTRAGAHTAWSPDLLGSHARAVLPVANALLQPVVLDFDSFVRVQVHPAPCASRSHMPYMPCNPNAVTASRPYCVTRSAPLLLVLPELLNTWTVEPYRLLLDGLWRLETYADGQFRPHAVLCCAGRAAGGCQH